MPSTRDSPWHREESLHGCVADDEYEPGTVSAVVKGIMAGHDVVMGLSRFIDADGNVTADHPANVHDHYDHAMLLRFWKYAPISQPATVLDPKDVGNVRAE